MAKLFVDLELSFSRFTDGLQRATRQATAYVKDIDRGFGRLNSTLGKIGISLAGFEFVRQLKQAVELQDELGNLAERTGITTEALSGLRVAAILSDSSLEELSKALVKLSTNVSDAGQGLGYAGDAFAALDLKPEEFATLDKLLAAIADKFQGFADGANKTAIAVKIFGTTGANLIPLLNKGSEGLARFNKQAEEFAVIVGGDAAKAAGDFNDSLDRLAIQFDGIKIALANSIIGPIADWITANIEAIKITGSLGEALRLFVFNLDAMTTERPVEQLNRLQAKLAEFEGAGPLGKLLQSPSTFFSGESFSTFGPVGLFDPESFKKAADQRRADLQKQITFLRFLSNQEDLRIARGVTFEDEDLGDLYPAKPQAPTIQDLAGLAKAQADASVKGLERFVQEEAKLLDFRKSLIQRGLETNQLSIEESFAAQDKIVQESAARQVEAIEQEIAVFEKLKRTKGLSPTEIQTAQGKIDDAQVRRAQIIQRAGEERVKLDYERIKAVEAFNEKIRTLKADIADLQGNPELAFQIRFEIANKNFREQLTRAGRSDLTALLDQQLESGQTTISVNRQLEESVRIQQNLAVTEERLRNLREAGGVGEIAQLAQLSTARREALEQLRAVKTQIDVLISSSSNPDQALIQRAKQLTTEIERLEGQADILAQRFKDIFSTGFADAFTEVIDGTKSVSEAFHDMANDIVRQINRLVAEELTTKLFNLGKAGAGAATGGAGGGGNVVSDFLDNIFSGFANIFGGAHAGGVAGTSYTFNRVMSPLAFAGAPRYHTGGVIGQYDYLAKTLAGLTRDEVPIIAQRGEGIFTPTQMRQLAPVGPVSAFTPAQLTALAPFPSLPPTDAASPRISSPSPMSAPSLHSGGLAGAGVNVRSFTFQKFHEGGIVNSPTIQNFTTAFGGDRAVAPSATPLSVVNQFMVPAPTDQRTQSQIAAQAGQGIMRAIRRNR